MAVSSEEQALLGKLSVEELQLLVALKESGKTFGVLLNVVNKVIDIEKNYIFSLNEDSDLPTKHAYSKGKAAFGIQLLRLITAASSELARREKIQQEIRAKQGAQHE